MYNAGFAQKADPDAIINKVKENFNLVKDYQADVHIKINVDFLKVPESDAKIIFKQPDKVKIVSKDFAMIPKEGLNFSPVSIFKGKYSSVFVKNEVLGGSNTAVIKIVHMDDNKDFILSTVWIDTRDYVIKKAETTTKDNGTFILNMNYNLKKTKYPLPVWMQLVFKIKNNEKFKRRPVENDEEKVARNAKEVKGTVDINYSNYIVNKGISDDAFKEEKKN